MLYVNYVPCFGHGSQQRHQKGIRKMLTSTRLTHLLKILSVTGMAGSIGVLIMFLPAAMFGTPDEDAIIAFSFFFYVGLPLYGLLYVGLKLREYLKEIEAVLLKQQT